MTTKLTGFFKTLKTTRLTDAERDAFRADFISYMHAHPYEKRREENQFLTLARFLFKKPVAITLCLALVIFGTGSVAYASNRALPGDILYPIKVNLNEEIVSAFLPKEEKARFEVKRTARRIEEAAELVRNGRLTPESAQIVQAQIEQHRETISELTWEIKAEGDAKIAADIHTELEATLAVNEQIFTDVVQQKNIETEETQILVAVIEAAEDAVKTENTKAVIALVQNDEIGEEELQKIAEEISMDVDQETAAVQEAAEATPAESQIAQKFAAAQTIKQEGERRLKEGAVKESVALFQEAKTRSQEVGKLVKISEGKPQIARMAEEIPSSEAQARPITTPAPVTEAPSVAPAPESAVPALPQTVALPQAPQQAVISKEPIQPAPIVMEPSSRINNPPKIIAYPPSPKDALAERELSFTWEAFDPDGDTLHWDVIWGNKEKDDKQPTCGSETCSRINASHLWDASGTYTVRVRVGDTRGGSDRYSFTIHVQSAIKAESTEKPEETQETLLEQRPAAQPEPNGEIEKTLPIREHRRGG